MENPVKIKALPSETTVPSAEGLSVSAGLASCVLNMSVRSNVGHSPWTYPLGHIRPRTFPHADNSPPFLHGVGHPPTTTPTRQSIYSDLPLLKTGTNPQY